MWRVVLQNLSHVRRDKKTRRLNPPLFLCLRVWEYPCGRSEMPRLGKQKKKKKFLPRNFLSEMHLSEQNSSLTEVEKHVSDTFPDFCLPPTLHTSVTRHYASEQQSAICSYHYYHFHARCNRDCAWSLSPLSLVYGWGNRKQDLRFLSIVFFASMDSKKNVTDTGSVFSAFLSVVITNERQQKRRDSVTFVVKNGTKSAVLLSEWGRLDWNVTARKDKCILFRRGRWSSRSGNKRCNSSLIILFSLCLSPLISLCLWLAGAETEYDHCSRDVKPNPWPGKRFVRLGFGVRM